MINNVAKLLKKREFPTSGWDRSAAHEPRKKQANPLFWTTISSGNLLRKIIQKLQKTCFFKRLPRAPHKKKWKNRVLWPENKQRHSHANRAQSNIFVKRTENMCFWKKYVRSPHEKSRNVGKIVCLDDWQSQKKSVKSWVLDNGKLILLGTRKVVCCCSFLLRCF